MTYLIGGFIVFLLFALYVLASSITDTRSELYALRREVEFLEKRENASMHDLSLLKQRVIKDTSRIFKRLKMDE